MGRLTFKVGGFNAFNDENMSTYGGVQKDGSVIYIGDVANKLAEYEDLEEQGRLLKLPCKVGTIIYSLECGEIEPDVVTSFQNDGEDLWLINRLGGVIGRYGKTVFITREEAEYALREMEVAK